MGISSQINYYEKKAIDQRVRYTQKQCAVLSNQIVNNGFRNYNMSSLSGESGASIFEVEQLANNLEGRIPGALIGGILLGVIEILGRAYISSQLSDAIVFAVLIIVLLVKPTGLLGKQVQEKV